VNSLDNFTKATSYSSAVGSTTHESIGRKLVRRGINLGSPYMHIRQKFDRTVYRPLGRLKNEMGHGLVRWGS
jgi:hypothetical protein